MEEVITFTSHGDETYMTPTYLEFAHEHIGVLHYADGNQIYKRRNL